MEPLPSALSSLNRRGAKPRYPLALQRQLAQWALRQHAAGHAWPVITAHAAISESAFRRWIRLLPPAMHPDTPALLPVQITPEPAPTRASTAPLLLRSPQGFCVEGLSLDQIVHVLRALA